MDEPIADYNRLLPVAIARAVLEAAGKGTEMAAHLSPSFRPSLSLFSDHLRAVVRFAAPNNGVPFTPRDVLNNAS